MMNLDASWIFRTQEHRGCGIREASYSVGPTSWVPEACVWLQTEDGWKRLWVNSFAHCFAAQDITFASQVEADHWAVLVARTIIDRTLTENNAPASLYASTSKRYFAKILGLARRPLSALGRIKDLRYHN
jgi:hypothetical protein